MIGRLRMAMEWHPVAGGQPFGYRGRLDRGRRSHAADLRNGTQEIQMAKKAAPKPPRFSPETLEEAARKRAQSRVIKNYLEALLDAPAVSPATRSRLERRYSEIEETLPASRGVKRLQLTQELIDLQARIADATDTGDLTDLENAFVEEIGDYAERKGLSYAALRAVGVPANVLKRGGIARTRSVSVA